MRRERNERSYGVAPVPPSYSIPHRDPGKEKHKLVFALFLLVILVIVLLYSIISMNRRFSEDMSALNQKITELSTKETAPIPPSAPVEAPQPTVIYRYVCQDGREAEFAEDCAKNVVLAPIDVQPITTRELNTRITNVTLAPTCVAGFDGGRLYYDATLKPDNVSVEVKDIVSKENYKWKKTFNSETKKYRLFSICEQGEQKCPNAGDFSLTKGKYYFLRLSFNYEKTLGRVDLSNEYVIDTREGSTYTLPVCRS